MVRNLLYRLTPFTGSNYLWNLQELFKRIEIFNGRRIFAIAYGEGCDELKDVYRIIDTFVPLYDIIVHKVENTLWENTTFIPLLTKLKSDYDPTSITCYMHSKGVTRSQSNHVWQGYPGDLCVHVWAQAMYHYNLDQPYLKQIEDCFLTLQGKHPSSVSPGAHTAGSFRRVGTWPHFHPDCTWHFSGGFTWFRTAELFKRDWTKILPTKFGPESYWGMHFKLEESACIFADKLQCEPYQPKCLKKLGLLP